MVAVTNLLVTCSRTWFENDDGLADFRRGLAVGTLQRIAVELWRGDGRPAPGEGPVLHHGDEKRGDRVLAAIWESWGLPTVSHPADWARCGPDCPEDRTCRRRKRGQPIGWCVRAGHRRNHDMVIIGHDRYAAFIRSASPGATDCARRADYAGILGERVLFPLS